MLKGLCFFNLCPGPRLSLDSFTRSVDFCFLQKRVLFILDLSLKSAASATCYVKVMEEILNSFPFIFNILDHTHKYSNTVLTNTKHFTIF